MKVLMLEKTGSDGGSMGNFHSWSNVIGIYKNKEDVVHYIKKHSDDFLFFNNKREINKKLNDFIKEKLKLNEPTYIGDARVTVITVK